MRSPNVIKSACLEALDAMEKDPQWGNPYCSVVDPATVLEMVGRIEEAEQALSSEELQELGKLIRDLTSYITLHCGTESDPVRDDLLLQSGHLLGLTGI